MHRLKIPHLRWIIAGLLFLSTVVNYLDRQLLSVLAPTLKAELQITERNYSYTVISFQIAYGIMFMVGGWLIDVVNTRRGLALSFAGWSLASICHAFVGNVRDLCICRFLLGATQPGNFTAAVKAVSSWFPSRERGVAIGFVVAGVAIGGIIAPSAVYWLKINFGWRYAFLIPSLAGLVWLPLWLVVYREPRDHPWITDEELRHIESPLPDGQPVAQASLPTWGSMFFRPQTWAFVFSRFFVDPLAFFYWAWLPEYLVTAKGFTLVDLTKWIWIPYISLAAGQLIGGYFSGALIKRGMAPLLARKIGVSIPVLLTPVAILSLHATQIPWIMFDLSVATFGLGWWGANYNSAVMDAVPRSSTASVAGLASSFGLVSSVIVTWLTGIAAQAHAYYVIFWLNGVLMFVAVAATWLLLTKPMDEAMPSAIETVHGHDT